MKLTATELLIELLAESLLATFPTQQSRLLAVELLQEFRTHRGAAEPIVIPPLVDTNVLNKGRPQRAT